MRLDTQEATTALEKISSGDSGAKDVIATTVLNQTGAYLKLAGFSDQGAEDLQTQVVAEFYDTSFSDSGDEVFCVGDLWTGSVLASPDGKVLGVIDLEFAGLGKPLQDIAQLRKSRSVAIASNNLRSHH